MTKLTSQLHREAQDRAFDYLARQGRPLDGAVARFTLREGPIGAVLEALAGFQNGDGGFGQALEPDFRLPASSPMATSVAFELLRELAAPIDHELVKRGIAYLIECYEPAIGGWQDVPPGVNDHPHAPWWHHEPGRRYGPQGHWGNPCAALAAALWRHAPLVPDTLLTEVTRAGLAALADDEAPLREYVARGYEALGRTCGDREAAAVFRARVVRDAPSAVATDPERWKVEAFQPVWLVRDADDPLAASLRDVLEANLDFLIARQTDAGCWEPNWIWFGQPEEAFAEARRDWSSEQTALLLRIFSGHGRLAP